MRIETNNLRSQRPAAQAINGEIVRVPDIDLKRADGARRDTELALLHHVSAVLKILTANSHGNTSGLPMAYTFTRAP